MSKRMNRRQEILGGVGVVLGIWACLESIRNKERIDELPNLDPAVETTWQDYNHEGADYKFNREELGKIQYKRAGDTLSGYFFTPLYSEKERKTKVGSIFWNSIAHKGDASKSIYEQNLQSIEQVSIHLEEENRSLFFMNATVTPAGYYEKDKAQQPVKYASGKIDDQKNVSGTDYDKLLIIATDELKEDTSGAPALLREVNLSHSSNHSNDTTPSVRKLYYANVDFKA